MPNYTESTVSVRIASEHVHWLRSVLEAYDGLCSWQSSGDGIITLSTSPARQQELNEVLHEIARQVPLTTMQRVAPRTTEDKAPVKRINLC